MIPLISEIKTIATQKNTELIDTENMLVFVSVEQCAKWVKGVERYKFSSNESSPGDVTHGDYSCYYFYCILKSC